MENKNNKIEIYCKNPICFIHYLANHKIKLEQSRKDVDDIKKMDREGKINLKDYEKLAEEF